PPSFGASRSFNDNGLHIETARSHFRYADHRDNQYGIKKAPVRLHRRRLGNDGLRRQLLVDPTRPGIADTPYRFVVRGRVNLANDARLINHFRWNFVIFLKRKLYVYHWFGMLCTVIGLALVGTKSVFSSHSLSHTGAQSAIGIGLVLAGAFTTACQMIVEEVFLKKRGFHPLQAVGMEGVFGSLMMICIALPAVHFIPGNDLNGSYENVLDALYQMVDSPLLLVNCILYIFSIALFNYFGLSITRYLSAVHRTLIDALRTTLVWCISLVLYYSTSGRFGESFDVSWGLIQIDGFACLIIGTLIYNKVMDVSFISCCAEPDSIGDPEFNSEITETPQEQVHEQRTSQI
ncbi:hypothetical protein X801_02492, partial [Opisthorchis viverrini]